MACSAPGQSWRSPAWSAADSVRRSPTRRPRDPAPCRPTRREQRGRMSQTPSRRDAWRSLHSILLARGLVTQQQLTAAYEQQKHTRQRLGRVLIDMGAITEDDLVQCLAEQF